MNLGYKELGIHSMARANLNESESLVTNFGDKYYPSIKVMAVRVVGFSNGGYKIRKIFA